MSSISIDFFFCAIVSIFALTQKELSIKIVYKVRVLIAVGGGSPIDSMKAIAAVSTSGGSIDDYLGKVITVPTPPMVAIPTTSGTGSEATQFTIITNTEKDIKMLLKGADVATSQPSPESVMHMWSAMLQEYEELVYIPISSGLSGSCMTAQAMAQEEPYAGRVFVVDNGRVSTPMHRSVLDAVELAEKGYRAQKIKDILEKNREHMVIYVGLSTLTYLKKGGRISSVAAVAADVLKIKPVMKFGVGKLDVYQKCRGMKNARKAMIDAMKKEFARWPA